MLLFAPRRPVTEPLSGDAWELAWYDLMYTVSFSLFWLIDKLVS